MINITERAKQVLKKLLTVNIDLAEGRLRLMDRGQGKLGLGVDIEMPGDELVKYEKQDSPNLKLVPNPRLKPATCYFPSSAGHHVGNPSRKSSNS